MYVVIEGIDTAGKSTQLDLLQKKYSDAIFTKEPGGTQIGVKLRAMALNGEAKSGIAEMFLFLADRAEHIEEVVISNEDKMVISDRSMVSGIAYASIFELEKMIELNLLATNNVLPTHAVLLELSAEELTYRLSQKENDAIELRGIEYLMNIQNRMKETIIKLGINHLFVDASLKIEEIEKEIEDFLNGK
ncbi:dTMP kinase [Poseidonibacter lekithochrous]|uniref:dTMP kinase n=1 Tax=Poseidonibacter lekithochrous TaxID=1904463 RepID=UPI000D39E5A9|nr:dTMP kinase [Poseidonibacter lekithochrous]